MRFLLRLLSASKASAVRFASALQHGYLLRSDQLIAMALPIAAPVRQLIVLAV
jgi:hypothetical protein